MTAGGVIADITGARLRLRDQVRVIVTPPVDDGEVEPESPKRALPSKRVAEAAGLVAGVALGAVRLLYEEYYRAIHTNVDQVGVSTWRMVTTPMAALLTLSAAGLVALFAAVLVYRVVPDKASAWYGAAITLLLVFACLLAALWNALGRAWLPAGILVGTIAVAAAIAPPAQVQRREQLRLVRNWFLSLLALALAVLWSVAWVNAPNAARSLRSDGTAAAGVDVLLDIDAEPVCVLSLSPTAVPPDRTVLLLGEAGGSVILRDVRQGSTLRVPSDFVVMRSPKKDHC
jgi:hypothetical protein